MTTTTTRKSPTAKSGARRNAKFPRKATSRRKPYALTLEDDLLAIGMRVPPEERAKLPRDFNENLDHYLYGAPRKKPRRW